MTKELMKDTSQPEHEERAERVKQFEAKYGVDWESTMIEYISDFIRLPFYVVKAVCEGNLRTVLQWLGKGNIKDRVNAKCEEGGNSGLLCFSALSNEHDLMSYLLFNGADVNILESLGGSVLRVISSDDNSDLAVLTVITRKLLDCSFAGARNSLMKANK